MAAFDLLKSYLTPGEGEQVVRAYHCTSFNSRLLTLKAEGFLTVTSMRVVFYAHGSSYGGKSVLHSEVPIEDVSGINTYKGTYFNVFNFLVAAFASYIFGFIASIIIAALITFLVSQTDTLSFETRGFIFQLLPGVLGIIAALWSMSLSNEEIKKPILAATGFFLLAGGGLASMGLGILSNILDLGGGTLLSLLLSIATIIVGIFAIISLFRYAIRETMSLTIGSKGGSYTPISISGISVLGLFNTAALKALTAEPAFEAERMIKELGAVISDVQTLGDAGIQKWKAHSASPSADLPPSFLGRSDI